MGFSAIIVGIGILLIAQDPLRFDAVPSALRVQEARAEKQKIVRNRFAKHGLAYPPERVHLRIFKKERQLELWASVNQNAPFQKIHTYRICAASGGLGPKRREGDMQVPEGFYKVDRFNPWSSFHLSLGLNYPNSSDAIIAQRAGIEHAGTNIFIHGDCVSLGCLAMEDDSMKEIFLVALDSQQRSTSEIEVHLFPAQLNEKGWAELQKTGSFQKKHIPRWRQLKEGYAYFEEHRQLFQISVERETGAYQIRGNLRDGTPGYPAAQSEEDNGHPD
jgi:murein L,D-transpeptidase YafK